MEIKYRSNLCAGVVSIVMGIIVMFLVPEQIAEDFAVTYGITSRTIPYAVAVLWMGCGVALVIQSLVLKKEEYKILIVKKEIKALGYMVVILLYALLFNKSFLLSTLFLGLATLAFTGTKKKIYYAIVVLAVIILYGLFAKVLHVQMP